MALESLLCWLYFWGMLFCLEERLWSIFVRQPLRICRELCNSAEWVAYQAIGVAFLGWWLPRAGQRLRSLCLLHAPCHRMLTVHSHGGFIDLSDKQWRDYRSCAPALICTCLLFALLGRLTRQPTMARQLCSLVMLLVLHGLGTVYVMALLVCFQLATGRKRATWLLVAAALVVKEPTVAAVIRRTVFNEGTSLYPWHAAFPLLTLRLASSSLDGASSTADVFTHALYAPLYATGPTIRFVDFTPRKREVMSYTLRTALAWLFLELGLRRYPCFAIAESSPHLLSQDPVAGAAFVIIALNLIFLKFAVIWRVATGLARIDGLAPPHDNLLRFVCNNFTVSGFWREWHASFHHWLLTYLYFPLGGNRSPYFAPAAVFAFTIVWHDAVQRKLVAWGGLNVLFLVVERRFGLADQAKRAETTDCAATRAIVAAQAAFYVFALLAANVIGFSVGIDGLWALVHAFQHKHCPIHLFFVFLVLFVAMQLAIKVRRIEFRFAQDTHEEF